ncbi:MAG TPA: ATP-grasp domain-containing protein [Candidatus Polarisedimenticolia bacterium]|nr:ATP-grasp domain-containing protein [Candidatus Polarisedimenticolia bacterium]
MSGAAPARPRVLLLLPTTTYRASDFIHAGSRLGIATVVGSDRKQALADVAPAHTLTLDLGRAEEAAAQIAGFAERWPLQAVIPTDDQTAVVAALASARLGLPHNPPEAARAARHKDRLRATLCAAGVRTPRYRLLPLEADPIVEADGQTYPCVLKPTFLAASRGVIRADTPREFTAAFHRIAALFALPEVAEKAAEAYRGVLVEEFVPGAEVAVEGLLAGGRLRVLAIFDKPDPLDGPFFEETIYVTPSRHEVATREAITEATGAAARALGLREGPIHAELRVGTAGPWVIELAARSIGGLCSRVLRFGTGRSLEELILMQALGRDLEGLEREPGPAGVMMIPIPRAGILREAGGLDRARQVPGIVEVTISAAMGKPLVPLPEGSSYLGFIFARGETPDETEAALREAHRRLAFVIETG